MASFLNLLYDPDFSPSGDYVLCKPDHNIL